MLILFMALAFCGVVAMAQRFEPKWVGEVAVLDCSEDTVMIPTEKANVQVKTSNSAGRILFDIGNVRRKIIVKGGRSTTQLRAGEPIYLVVKCKDNETDPSGFIQVVRFEEKKKERRSELAKVNWLDNVTQGNMDFVPYTADAYGRRSYLLCIEPQEGEFGVRILNPDEVDEKMPIFYCFGVHADDSDRQ